MKNGEIRKKLDGAWEERGVVGSRIEIEKDKLTVLWRGGVVLETKFKSEQDGDAVVLKLAQNGMRYKGDSKDYATVTDIHYDGDALFFEENFPITGKSVTKMQKTENSRYGNVKVIDGEVLRELGGKWISDSGYSEMSIKGNTLELDGMKIKIHVVSDALPDGPFGIIDDDPSKSGIGYFYSVRYNGEVIKAVVPVCDAPSITEIFRKVK